MPWKFRARTIREEHTAAHAVNEFSHQFERFEDAYRALQWLLSQDCDIIPSKHKIVNDIRYNLYVQDSNPIAHTPWIAVLYTYDDNMVNIIDILAGQ